MVSVILPFLNADKTIAKAIHSIQKQSFTDFECLLIDNGSVDESIAISKKITRSDSRFRILKEKNQGVAKAFKKGYAFSKGQLIARMDADDEMLVDRLETQVNFLKNNPCCDAVGGLAEYISNQPNVLDGFRRFVDWNNSLISYQDIWLNRFVEQPLINPTMMWRRAASEKYGIYRHGDFPEDYDMWLRWLDAGARIQKVNEVVLRWYDSADRLSRSHYSYREEAFYQTKSAFLAEWLQKNIFREIWVWGASALSRQRLKHLKLNGIEISGYIDIHEKRQLRKPVIHYSKIPGLDNPFILVYLGHENQKKETINYLQSINFISGHDFLLVS